MFKKKAIVLDASVETLRQVENYFAETGITEISYSGDDGSLGLARALELKPELLIVNMFLKNIDGCEVIRAIKKSLPKTKILAMGNASDSII